ncbi:MAG: hypothetical protein Q7R62_00230 [bacterium]|nr:hypothetical protein [bacterium]
MYFHIENVPKKYTSKYIEYKLSPRIYENQNLRLSHRKRRNLYSRANILREGFTARLTIARIGLHNGITNSDTLFKVPNESRPIRYRKANPRESKNNHKESEKKKENYATTSEEHRVHTLQMTPGRLNYDNSPFRN